MEKNALCNYRLLLSLLIICLGLFPLIPSCGGGGKSGGGGPVPHPYAAVAFYPPNNYEVGLRYINDSQCLITSISVTGPFMPVSLPLTCRVGDAWALDIQLGNTSPAPMLPLAYTFTVTVGGSTRQEIGTAPCVWDLVPTPIQPTNGSIVTNPVTFSWVKTIGSNIRYYVRVYGLAPSVCCQEVIDSSTLVVTLPKGSYSNYTVFSGPAGYEGGSGCSSKVTVPWSFTVQ